MLQQFFVWFFGSQGAYLVAVCLAITFILLVFGAITRWVVKP